MVAADGLHASSDQSREGQPNTVGLGNTLRRAGKVYGAPFQASPQGPHARAGLLREKEVRDAAGRGGRRASRADPLRLESLATPSSGTLPL